MHGVSLHRGPEAVFGVVNGAMTWIGSGDLVSCSGVTIFPPGSRWVTLALLSSGFTHDVRNLTYGGGESVNKGTAGYAEEHVTDEEEEVCLHIYNRVQDVLDGTKGYVLEADEDLVSLLDGLFCFWTQRQEIPLCVVEADKRAKSRHQPTQPPNPTQPTMLVSTVSTVSAVIDSKQYDGWDELELPGTCVRARVRELASFFVCMHEMLLYYIITCITLLWRHMVISLYCSYLS